MHRRTGRPQARPLTCVLTHDETRQVKELVAKRGTSVNALLKTLIRAELKTVEQLDARLDKPNIQESPNIAPGFIPKIDHSRQRDKPRESDAPSRSAANRIASHFRD